MIVEDLDVLNPEPKSITLGGEEILVSFIPCGITFPVDALVRELSELDQGKLATDIEEQKKAFDLSVRLCVTFCSVEHPEMDREYFDKKVSPRQVERFATWIRGALEDAYKGIESTPQRAARKKNR